MKGSSAGHKWSHVFTSIKSLMVQWLFLVSSITAHLWKKKVSEVTTSKRGPSLCITSKNFNLTLELIGV